MQEQEKQSIDNFEKKFSKLSENEKAFVMGYILHATETREEEQEEQQKTSIPV